MAMTMQWPVFCSKINKLAKARKTRKSPGTLGLKKFWPGKLWVKKKVWTLNFNRRQASRGKLRLEFEPFKSCGLKKTLTQKSLVIVATSLVMVVGSLVMVTTSLLMVATSLVMVVTSLVTGETSLVMVVTFLVMVATTMSFRHFVRAQRH